MRVRVYKNGENKRIELFGTSLTDDYQYIDIGEFHDVQAKKSGNRVSITEPGRTIVRTSYSNYQDKDGNSLGNSIREVVEKLNAILKSNTEVDRFIIGSKLASKSEDTQFVHNDSITNGGAVVLSDNGSKIGVEGNHIDFDSTGSYGDAEINVKTSGSQSARAIHVYGSALSQAPQIDFEGDVDFQQSVSGIGVTDLDDTPGSLGNSGQVLAVNSGGTALEFVNQTGGSGGSGSASEALFVIDSTGGTDNVTSTASNLTLDSTRFISTASNFTVSNNEITVNMNMRACISFYVGFKDPNGADRSEGQAFLERSTDSGSTWSLVTGSNSFAYLRNGGNNDQDTATSGNVIMAVSSGDKFRVRVKTTGTGLTASTIANMSGFSIFDLLGGATGATGATGPAGADGADGTNGTNGTNGADGADGSDGTGFTGGSYNSSTGVVTFTSNDGLGFSTGDLRGADGADGADGTNGTNGTNGTDGADGADGNGFTGGSYNSSTGIVTFTSDDGLGFSTGDLRSSLAFADLTGKPTTISGYGITDALQLGTTSTTALAGDTTTITSAQASAITANTAKTSFPGFGTSAGTALEGNTVIPDPLADANQTLTGNRDIDVDGNYFRIKNGANIRMQYDPNDDRIEFTNGVQISGDLVTTGGGLAAGQMKLQEPAMGGSNGVILKAPSTNLSADVTFVLPDADGSNGQVLQTDGSGNLSFSTVSGGGTQQTLDGQKIEFVTRSTAYGNGSYEGKVMKFGTATLQSLKLYQYTSSGWSPTDANQTGKAEGMLGLALGTSESSDGLLLDGLISATAFTGFSAGDTLYVSETESAITNTAPTATGSIVRIVGYALGSGYVHFNPSDNFIELA